MPTENLLDTIVKQTAVTSHNSRAGWQKNEKIKDETVNWNLLVTDARFGPFGLRREICVSKYLLLCFLKASN